MRKLFSSNKSQKKSSWKKIKANESHLSSISDSFPTKHSTSSISSQRTSRTLIESHSEPIPMPVRSLSLPPTLAMPKPRYTVYPTQDLLKSYENEKTQIESSSDELSESGTSDMLKEGSEKEQSQEYKYRLRRKSIVTDSILKMNNTFEPPSPQSIQKSPSEINTMINDNNNVTEQMARQRSTSTHSGYHLTISSDSTEFTSKTKNTASSSENITKPSIIDSYISRPVSSSGLPATIGSDVTQNMKNKYTNNHDKPPEPFENLSSEQQQPMSDSTTSLLNTEIQSQLQKLALREDLEDLRRIIDMLKQQSMRDREEYLERVKEQKKVEKEIFDQIKVTKQRLDELVYERNQTQHVEEGSQTNPTRKKRESLSEPATTRRNRKPNPYPEQQDDNRYFYEQPRMNYDAPDYHLPRSFINEMDGFSQPFYSDDYLYDLNQANYGYPPPPPPLRKNRPRSKSADYQRMNFNPFDSPHSTRQSSSRKSSIHSSRSNRSKEFQKEDLEENGYHSAAEEEDDIPKNPLKPNESGHLGSGTEGREQEEQQKQREVPVSRHSSRGSSGRFRRRPSNTNNNMASSIPPHLMYHNPGFRPHPHPHYLPPINPNRVNERERHGTIPYNIPPGSEYPHQYVPQGLSSRHMGFSEGPPRPPIQSMGWPPNTNQNMYGMPPHHHHHRPPPGGGGSTMTEGITGNSTGSHPIPNYETGQDSVSQQPPGMRRYPPQQHGYQPLYPDSGQMVFL